LYQVPEGKKAQEKENDQRQAILLSKNDLEQERCQKNENR
jgi:hypothetical protein